jgi:hypothetical protein
MKYGFEDGKFYIDFVSRSRTVGTMREESDRRALEIGSTYPKIMLSFSGGVDSQCVLHSFYTQGIPIETVFMYMPGHNDNEHEQVKICDKKYSRTTHIVEVDPIAIAEEIISMSDQLDVPSTHSVLHAKFLSLLPGDYCFIQNAHDPYVYIHPADRRAWYVQGFHSSEVSRHRAFSSIKRSGDFVFWGDTTEYLLSVINDDVFKAAIHTSNYYDGSGFVKEGKSVKTVDRYDYFIKPLIYGKYWQDELIYFPKFGGYENIPYISDRMDQGKVKSKQHGIVQPYWKMLKFLNIEGGLVKRFYENLDPTIKVPYYDPVK